MRAIFWLALLFTFVMAVLPHPPTLPGAPGDKLQHIGAFVTLTILAMLAFRRARLVLILAGLAAFGGLIELVQAFPPLGRDADFGDWLADTGAIVFVLCIWLAMRMLRRLGEGEPTETSD